MKLVTLILIILLQLILLGCSDSIELKQNECKKNGSILKHMKSLNYRTGEYELKMICIKNKY
jgi:hypothetical protein